MQQGIKKKKKKPYAPITPFWEQSITRDWGKFSHGRKTLFLIKTFRYKDEKIISERTPQANLQNTLLSNHFKSQLTNALMKIRKAE